MSNDIEFILGEFRRSLDDRFRLSIPSELVDRLRVDESTDCILAKELPGCLSLWNAHHWKSKMEDEVKLVRDKMRAGKLQGDISQVQLLGRLLSTRHATLQLGGRGRLLIPEGFREFLQVEPGEDALVIGAALCVEIWKPSAWFNYLDVEMPKFRDLLAELAG